MEEKGFPYRICDLVLNENVLNLHCDLFFCCTFSTSGFLPFPLIVVCLHLLFLLASDLDRFGDLGCIRKNMYIHFSISPSLSFYIYIYFKIWSINPSFNIHLYSFVCILCINIHAHIHNQIVILYNNNSNYLKIK